MSDPEIVVDDEEKAKAVLIAAFSGLGVTFTKVAKLDKQEFDAVFRAHPSSFKGVAHVVKEETKEINQ